MKNRVYAALLLLGISAYAQGAVDSGPKDMTYTGPVTNSVEVCMIKRTVQPHTSYVYDYQGKTYHFCCTMCLSKFKSDPDHMKMAIDPINGKPVDKASALIYAYKGRAYFFSSIRTLSKFSKRPKKYLTKENTPS